VYDPQTVEASVVFDYPLPVQEYITGGHRNGAIVQTCVGVDWGVAHKACYVVVGLDAQDPPMAYVLDSFGIRDMRLKDFRHMVIESVIKWGPSDLCADSNWIGENRALRQEMGEANVELGVQSKAFGKYKMAMISEVRRRFEKMLIQISIKYGHNKQLLDQLYAYEYAASLVETDGRSEKTVKINDDYLDALDLACWPLKPGTAVMSGGGYDGLTGMYPKENNVYQKRETDSMSRLPGFM